MQGRYAAREQALWITENASRFIRPDAARFLKPGTRVEDVYPALALKYNPNQPRVPAGNSDGGRWTDGEGGIGRLAQPMGNIGIIDRRVVSDADPESIKPGAQYADVIRVCIASGISLSTDQWGNRSYTVTFDCAGGRSFTRFYSGRYPGLVRDPYR